MAKQRRDSARAASRKPAKSASRQPRIGPPPSAKAAAPAVPPKGVNYLEAVALYEQGVQAVQRREYARATGILRSVLAQYPDEKELHERVRLYLNICERQTVPAESTPRNREERKYAATLAFNAGEYATALAHLRGVQSEDPNDDHALYMLAVIQALQGDAERALAHLQQAVELNPENRALARQDPDLEALRQLQAFRALVERPNVSRPERRRPPRGRVTR